MRGAALAALPVVLAACGALAWAGSQGGARLAGWPVFALCVALAFAINVLAFVPAWLARSEKYYDLTGSATHLAVVGLALAAGPGGPRALLLAGLIALWAIRLGTFLFARVRAAGGDARFDRIKHDFGRFLLAFTLQGLWVALTTGAALAAMTASPTPSPTGPPVFSPTASPAQAGTPLGVLEPIGVAIWLAGFALEVTADRQKQAFRSDPANRDRFVTSGLWSRSRHPNYFGEIVLWTGIALIALPALVGWQRLTLVSPLFVYLLLTRVSGIPLLEARARRRWGHDPAYRAWVERTPRLIPRLRE